MINKIPFRPFIRICSFALLLIFSAGLAVPAYRPAQAIESQASTQAPARLATPIVQILADRVAPSNLIVDRNQAFIVVNNDSVAHTIQVAQTFLGEEPTATYKAYLPVLQNPNNGNRPAAEAARAKSASIVPWLVDDEFTLQPGEQKTLSYARSGVVTLILKDDAARSLLVQIQAGASADAFQNVGSVVGRVLDYSTKEPLEGARIKTLESTVEVVAGVQGSYLLPLEAGEYTLVVYANGYTFANRKITVSPYDPTAVDTIELVPLDERVTPIDSSGGVVMNSAETTNIEFAPGAIDSTKAIRLTVLTVDEMSGDYSALPGPFTNGRVPLGFVSFEPDGTVFDAPAVWTIEYDGPLPVGTYVPCFYWIEADAEWGEPVDGTVVDLGNGKKGLRATLPHFSAYGFAAAPPPDPGPPELNPPLPSPDDFQDEENNPNEADVDYQCGSQVNFMTGELCQQIGTYSLPNTGGLPTQITAKYYSRDMGHQPSLTGNLTVGANTATPDGFRWEYAIAGNTFSGSSAAISVQWDERSGSGELLAPGLHHGRLKLTSSYRVTSMGAGAVSCDGPCGVSNFTRLFAFPLPVVRTDLSPFGVGWFGAHDVLLADNGRYITIVESDSKQTYFKRENDGTIKPPKHDFSTLAQAADGSWTRTWRDGSTMQFNADGRLTRIADRYDNFQIVTYEDNGKTYPASVWGLTTRIKQVADKSGNTFTYAYGSDGYVDSITDSAGRVYNYEHDGAGNLIASIDPLGQRETYTYNGAHMMTSHTDKMDNLTSYELDGEGKLLRRIWPTGSVLSAEYSTVDDPNIIQRTTITLDRGSSMTVLQDEEFNPVATGNGVYTSTTQFNDNLLPSTASHAPGATFYDEYGNVIDSISATRIEIVRSDTYDQPQSIVSSTGSRFDFELDALGNVTRSTNVLGQQFNLTWNADGQPATVTDPLGNSLSLTYNDRGQVIRIVNPVGEDLVITYDSAGRPSTVTDALDRTATYTYDALNRPVTITDPLNGETAFVYDANSNLLSITDPTNRTIGYSYDVLDRMTQMTYPDGQQSSYSYDPSGNLLNKTDPRGTTVSWSYDDAGRPISQTADGNTVAYDYDELSQLRTVADGSLQINAIYLDGTTGYSLREQVSDATRPLNSTVEHLYSNGLVDGGFFNLTTPSAATNREAGRDTITQATSERIAWNPSARARVTCDQTISGDIATSLTFNDPSKVYCFTGGRGENGTKILAGVTVNVGPGVQFAGYGRLAVEGTLNIVGTATNPAIMSRITPNGTNANTTHYYIEVAGSGELVLDQMEMYHTGAYYSPGQFHGIKVVDNASLHISNSIIGIDAARSAAGTIRAEGAATVSIVDSTISSDHAPPLDLESAPSSGVYTISGSTIQYAPRFGDNLESMRFAAQWVGPLLNGTNQIVSTTSVPSQIILNGGTVTGNDVVWKSLYETPGMGTISVNNSFTVAAGAKLTVKGRNRLFFKGAGVAVRGEMALLGTEKAEVSLWGPTTGFNLFSGIQVYAGGLLTTEHANIHRERSSFNGTKSNITLFGDGQATVVRSKIHNGQTCGINAGASGILTVIESQIAQNGTHGVCASGATVLIENSALVSNGAAGFDASFSSGGSYTIRRSLISNNAAGVGSLTPAAELTIVDNWWGDPTGPRGSAENPNGRGQSVPTGAIVAPWSGLPGDARYSGYRIRTSGVELQQQHIDYDAAGNATSMWAAYGVASYSVDYLYDGKSRMIGRSASDTIPFDVTYSYDAADRLTAIAYSQNGAPLLSQSYGYDAVSNIASITSSRDGTLSYSYDGLDRLTGINSNSLTTSYAYDAAGNRTSAGSVQYSYDAGGKLTAASDGSSYGYDAAGNLISRANQTLSWDAQGQLTRIDYSNGSHSAYDYDDFGRRISQRLPDGTVIYFIYNGSELVQELNADGSIRAAYAYDGLDRPVSMWRGGELYYFLLDHLGSVLGLVDANGTIVATYQYDPWGNLLASSGTIENRLRYAGREYDAESGLYYNRARYYDPTIGRFISRDPLNVIGGQNLYEYAAGDPIANSDPFGLAPWDWVPGALDSLGNKLFDKASDAALDWIQKFDPSGLIKKGRGIKKKASKALKKVNQAVEFVGDCMTADRIHDEIVGSEDGFAARDALEKNYDFVMKDSVGGVLDSIKGIGPRLSEALREQADVWLGNVLGARNRSSNYDSQHNLGQH